MEFHQFNVLVVDDIENMRQLITGMLREMNITRVHQAGDGLEALEVLRRPNLKFDLLIVDWNMPRMSGIELLKAIREDSELADQRFLMVTAEAEKSKVVEAIKLRVNSYIIKPLTQTKLEEKITEIMSA